MKVTKIIREYIEDRVNKEFAPRIEAIEEEIGKKKTELKRNFSDHEEELNSEATFIAHRANTELMELANRLGVTISSHYYRHEDKFFSFNIHQDPSGIEKLSDQLTALQAKRRAVIQDILVSLELGASKAELEMRLAHIDL